MAKKLQSTITAIEILQAIEAKNWTKLLEFYPEGIIHRGSRYHTLEDFQEWENYEEFARYIGPAREILIDLCLSKAINLLEK